MPISFSNPFGAKKAEPPATNAEAAEDSQDSPLDTLGAVLHSYGQHAFDTDSLTARELKEECDTWVRHLLYGAPRHEEDFSGPKDVASRDWNGFRTLFAQWRKSESDFVRSTTKGARDSFFTLVDAIRQTLSGDRENDIILRQQIDRLNAAAQEGSLQNLQSAVVEVVGQLRDVASKREAQHEQLVVQLERRVEAMTQQLKEVKEEAKNDPLTGIANRRTLNEQLESAISACQSRTARTCLLLLDIDHFKRLNDTHGHPAGDACLKALANRLVSVFPGRDDCVARYGGEEFAVLLPGVDDRNAGDHAWKLVDAVRVISVNFEGVEIGFTVSVGVAVVNPEDTADEWIARADRALYRAKAAGRDQVKFAA